MDHAAHMQIKENTGLQLQMSQVRELIEKHEADLKLAYNKMNSDTMLVDARFEFVQGSVETSTDKIQTQLQDIKSIVSSCVQAEQHEELKKWSANIDHFLADVCCDDYSTSLKMHLWDMEERIRTKHYADMEQKTDTLGDVLQDTATRAELAETHDRIL